MLGGTLRLILGILALLFVLPACATVTARVALGTHGPPAAGGALLIGVLLAAALVWWRRPNWLIHTAIHEACHALFCVLLGVRIRSFQATDGRGGAVIHSRVDPVRTTLIALAPYVWPLLLTPVLALRWWVDGPGAGRVLLTFLCGFLAVHHLHGLYHNVRLNFWGRQADLTRAGKVLSLAAIASAHCLWAAAWLAVVFHA